MGRKGNVHSETGIEGCVAAELDSSLVGENVPYPAGQYITSLSQCRGV